MRPLRVAGQSLSEELDDVFHEQVMAPYFLAVIMILVAGMEWWRYFADAKPNPLIFSIVALVCVGYAVYKIVRVRKKVRQIKLGRDGERAVAQYLEWFRTAGFFVFHDVPSGDANLDHVLVGPKGIFTIETKTWSKPLRGECRVTVVDGVVRANGRTLDRDPLIQAKAQAAWLRAFFSESQFKAPVQPVVVMPGWFVEPFDMKKTGAWVLELKALEKFVEREPDRLTREEVKAMASALGSHIRSHIRL